MVDLADLKIGEEFKFSEDSIARGSWTLIRKSEEQFLIESMDKYRIIINKVKDYFYVVGQRKEGIFKEIKCLKC